jgi:hypothetical protein
MSTINLTEQQAAHLSQHGRVVVIEPVEPQPYPWPHDIDHITWEPADDYEITGRPEWVLAEMARDDYAPHKPGDVVLIAAQWSGDPDDGKRPIAEATVISTHAMRLHDVSVEMWMHTGAAPVDIASRFDMRAPWNDVYGRTPHDWHSNPVVWVIELEAKNV